ncbi:MAG: signal peptidase I [Tannerella sp.]|jgi:signal peptidase I|nr:signal peptidase I [Tannerella sp.]
MKARLKRISKWILKGAGYIVVTILLAIAMKVFLFANFTVPTGSMEPAILAGDRIIVNKLILGPRLYENFGFLNGKRTKLKRVRFIRKVRRNDILAFDFPYLIPNKIHQDGNEIYVKRCVAIPGDTFLIDNGFYRIKNFEDTIGHVERQKRLSEMDETSFRESIRYTFPNDTLHYKWTIKNFGPLYIPAKGDNLSFDTVSVILYKNLIEYETEQKVTIREGHVLLGDSVIHDYTFQQDYYFMAGEWIFDSYDSRYWGLLPDDLVIGKATVISTSIDKDTGKYRKGRFLKIIK